MTTHYWRAGGCLASRRFAGTLAALQLSAIGAMLQPFWRVGVTGNNLRLLLVRRKVSADGRE